MTSAQHPVGHLFVYGTLRPGDERWHFLRPFVVDEGWDDVVAGVVFDTGLGYPGAIFDGSETIHGRTFALLDSSANRCLEVLDEVESVVEGEYRRVVVSTGHGVKAWAYEYGADVEMTPIESGDWLNR